MWGHPGASLRKRHQKGGFFCRGKRISKRRLGWARVESAPPCEDFRSVFYRVRTYKQKAREREASKLPSIPVEELCFFWFQNAVYKLHGLNCMGLNLTGVTVVCNLHRDLNGGFEPVFFRHLPCEMCWNAYICGYSDAECSYFRCYRVLCVVAVMNVFMQALPKNLGLAVGGKKLPAENYFFFWNRRGC